MYPDAQSEPDASELKRRWLDAEAALAMSFDAADRARLWELQSRIERSLMRVDPDSLPKPAPAPPQRGLEVPGHALRFVIVGAGLGGLCMAARLREQGFADITILEQSDDLGGTWHHNRYPGVACDIAAHVYSLPFFPNPDWSQRSAPGAEIRAYLQRLSDQYELRKLIRFQACVTQCVHRGGAWAITTQADEHRADVLITATGFLHRPRFPAIPGLNDFAGSLFHSSCWPAGLVTRGKRVGIIGTGSSGTQVASALIGDVEQLDIFQRTPQWILPVANDRYSQRRRDTLRRFPDLLHASTELQLNAFNRTVGAAVGGDALIQQAIENACRQYLQSVRDPVLRRALTPPSQTRALCKRLVMSDSFYETIQHPGCRLVTVDIDGVEADGVRTRDGKLHALDVVILATGFDSHAYCKSLNISVEGGPSLADAWAHGARAFDSVAVAGFPNLFLVGGPHSPVGNLSTMICSQLQADYIVRLVNEMHARQAVAVLPTREAENVFVADMQAVAATTTWASGCTSWYLDAHGKLDMWTRSPEDYIAHLGAGPRMGDYDVVKRVAS